MDADQPPISRRLKSLVFWAMGIFLVLVAATLGLFVYALYARPFSPELAIEYGMPPAMGVGVVMFLIAAFHRKLQSASGLVLAAISLTVFVLAAAVTWGVLAFVLAHPSRQLELALRLIMLVVFIALFRVVLRQRKN